MPVYLIIEIEVIDPELYSRYVERVPETVELYNGKYLVRGGPVFPMSGNWVPERVIVLEFPSMDQVKKWSTSPEYLSIAPFRQQSTRSRAIAVQGFNGIT